MIEIPQSVASFRESPDIATAVRTLVKGKQKLPADLSWDEVQHYYAAVSAAHQVKCDFALTLSRLWQEVWQEATSGLTQLSPSQTEEFCRSNTPDDCWGDSGYARCVELSADTWLYAEVQLFDRSAAISVSIDGYKQKQLKAQLGLADFSFSDDKDWIYFEAVGSLSTTLPELRQAAERVVVAARQISVVA